MSSAITDVEGLKDFLRQRAQETWDDRGIPYYLSLVAIDLKRKDVDYRTFTGPLRLVQWVSKEDIPETKLVAHPTIKAKVGLIPSNVDYDFSSEPTADLGSRLIDGQSQKMTAAARAMADRKTFGHLSYRVAMRRQSFSRPNMISMRLRRL